MTPRSLLTAGLLLGGVALAPQAAQAGWSSYTSTISEVDACNQAQYLMPEKALAQEFRLRSRSNSQGISFECKVRWSDNVSAKPTDRPILFPYRVPQPLFAAGWF
jgi:hypothetical protein